LEGKRVSEPVYSRFSSFGPDYSDTSDRADFQKGKKSRSAIPQSFGYQAPVFPMASGSRTSLNGTEQERMPLLRPKPYSAYSQILENTDIPKRRTVFLPLIMLFLVISALIILKLMSPQSPTDFRDWKLTNLTTSSDTYSFNLSFELYNPNLMKLSLENSHLDVFVGLGKFEMTNDQTFLPH
jgi:hypothetical protein